MVCILALVLLLVHKLVNVHNRVYIVINRIELHKLNKRAVRQT